MKLNQEKCGSSNWINFIQSADFEDFKFENHNFILSTKENIGTLEIDNYSFSVESNLYLNIYFWSNSQQKSNDILFNLLLKEIISSSERDSITEILISNDDSYDISIWIFIILSIWI